MPRGGDEARERRPVIKAHQPNESASFQCRLHGGDRLAAPSLCLPENHSPDGVGGSMASKSHAKSAVVVGRLAAPMSRAAPVAYSKGASAAGRAGQQKDLAVEDHRAALR